MADETPRRFVLDINVLVSAFLFPSSVPGEVFARVVHRHRLLMSMEAASELADVLRREKFDRYVSRKRREELLAAAISISDFVKINSKISDCRDPGDNKFLDLAIDGAADAIVSGDDDLLQLNPYRGMQIITPQQFLEIFAGS